MRKSTLLLVGIFLAMISAGLFLRSSFFKIEEIQIEATSLEVKKIAEKVLSDIKGKSLWEIQLSELTALLTSKSQVIASVFIQRHWPHVLRVKIEERQGIAQTFIDHELWVIDKSGISFLKKAATLPLFWPLPTRQKNYIEVMAWLAQDKPTGVNGLTWDSELGLVLLLNQKSKIVMGRENFPANWKKAREAVEYLKNKGLQARRIDATYNNRAVVSL